MLQSSLDARRKRGLIAGAAFGYSQAIIFWVFALLFYVGAVLVDDGTLEYDKFFTAMFAVIFGAFGVGQVYMTYEKMKVGDFAEMVGKYSMGVRVWFQYFRHFC